MTQPEKVGEGGMDGEPDHPHEMVALGAELDGSNSSTTEQAVAIAYAPEPDSWRELPPTGLSPQASALAWTGSELVAWDYGLNAAAYDPVRDQWRTLPRLPLRDSECYPETQFIGRYVFAWFCGQAATWDVVHESWAVVDLPRQVVPGSPVVAGEVLLFAGATYEAEHNSFWVWVPRAKK